MADLSTARLRRISASLQEAIHKKLPNEDLTFVGTLADKVRSFRVCYKYVEGADIWQAAGISISIAPVQKKVAPRVPSRWEGAHNALWEQTGNYRLSVSSYPQPTRSFYQLASGDFNWEMVAHHVAQQWHLVKLEQEKKEAQERGLQHFSEVKEQLDKAFKFSETMTGDRYRYLAIDVEADDQGLTIDIRKRLTEEEARTILRTIDSLGLLPGGVRVHERPVPIKVQSRFERVR